MTEDLQYVQFKNVKKSYDQRSLVVKDFSLDIKKGEFVTLLGPSGSGKTTCLMMLAGFEEVTSGEILVNNKPITHVAPYDRNIGMVFQHYALFPHLTVEENLAYPLRVRKLPESEINRRVAESLELVELDVFGKRYPAHLSGGQRQRVALARSLIFEPSIVLMDEPLGALDKNLREQMQFEIKRLHEKLGFTAIYVTHDQTEALTMSDRIAVFNDGIVQQCASPDTLYERPENAFVADFIGENNHLQATVVAKHSEHVELLILNNISVKAKMADCPDIDAKCVLAVRPENIFFASQDVQLANKIDAQFITQLYVGDFIRYFFKLKDNTEIMVKLLNDHQAPTLKKGEMTCLTWSIEDGLALDIPTTQS
jgi:putative spermidine/putrescine transport system ATP-binding protein